MKSILIVSQVIPQWYADLLTGALGENVNISIITGSKISGNINVISSPEHDSNTLVSRFLCWWKHYSFLKKWMKQNKTNHYDLIFLISNPPINSYIGLKLKKLYKAPFIYMNWDLYPQVIETSLSYLFINKICLFWHKWNDKNYKKIDKMLTIGSIMANSMNNDLNSKINIDVIPIAVDTNKLHPIDKDHNKFCIQNNLINKFVVLYSGKMGRGHNIELILKVAQRLIDYTDIIFVFIGDGSKYKLIETFMNDNQSKNILLFPFQSEEMFPYSIACGDIGIVSQEASMAHLFMPSKTYSMMACGEAIMGIGTNADDLYSLINSEGIGYSIVDSSVDSLCDAIMKLYQNETLLNKMKLNSRRVAEEKFSLSVINEQYSKLFKEVM